MSDYRTISSEASTYLISPSTGSSVIDSDTELLTSFSTTYAGPLEEESDSGAEMFADIPDDSVCVMQAVMYTDAGSYERMNYIVYTDDTITETWKHIELSAAPYSPYDPALADMEEASEEVDTEEDESEEMGTEEEEESASGGGGEGYS